MVTAVVVLIGAGLGFGALRLASLFRSLGREMELQR